MAEAKELGEIVSLEGSVVKVKMREHASCASCGHKTICFPAGRHRVLLARAEPGIHEGDLVCIDFPSGPSIVSSLLIFVGSVFVPLIAWLLAEFAFKAPVLARVAFAAGALLIYWVFLYILNRRLKRSGWFLPRAYRSDGEVITEEKED
jgi:positive regulator of sigma E activity